MLIQDMTNIWDLLAEANENKNKNLQSIEPDGTVTTRDPNTPMFTPEFRSGQEIIRADVLPEFDFALSPTEEFLKDKFQVVDSIPLRLTHFVNDELFSVPVYKSIRQIVGVLSQKFTVTFSVGKFVSRLFFDGVELTIPTSNEIEVNKTVIDDASFEVIALGSVGEEIERYTIVVYELQS